MNREIISNEDKVWVNMAQVVNLGNYENVRIEVGLSKTLKESDDPMKVIENIQEGLEDFLVKKVKDIKR